VFSRPGRNPCPALFFAQNRLKQLLENEDKAFAVVIYPILAFFAIFNIFLIC
jgi:hypothetical protein